MLGRRMRARDLVLMEADSELSGALRPAPGQSVGNRAGIPPVLTSTVSFLQGGPAVPSRMEMALCKKPGHSSSCLTPPPLALPPPDLEALIGSLSPH